MRLIRIIISGTLKGKGWLSWLRSPVKWTVDAPVPSASPVKVDLGMVVLEGTMTVEEKPQPQ